MANKFVTTSIRSVLARKPSCWNSACGSRLIQTSASCNFPRRRAMMPAAMTTTDSVMDGELQPTNLRRASRRETRTHLTPADDDEFIANNFVSEPVASRTQFDDNSLRAPGHASDRPEQPLNTEKEPLHASRPSPATRHISIRDINMLLNHDDATDGEQPENLSDVPPLEAVDPRKLSVFLFPGQGSQFVGMGRKLMQYPNVPDLFHVASSILGYNLLDVCLNGPQQKLNQTVVSQAAVYVCSMAALESIKAEHPEAIENCYTCAGFSVGEYAALTFADAIDFQVALQVLKARAEAMQRASQRSAGGLISLKLSHKSNLQLLIEFAKRECGEKYGIENPVCNVAGYLFADCKLVGGHDEALQFIEKNAADFHVIPLKRVPVSGAFHTHLMYKAQAQLKAALDEVELRRPNIPVISNYTASEYQHPEQIKNHLVQQLTKPIKWEQTMMYIFKRPEEVPMPHVYEVGPGSQLRTMLKYIGSIKNQRAVSNFHSIEV